MPGCVCVRARACVCVSVSVSVPVHAHVRVQAKREPRPASKGAAAQVQTNARSIILKSVATSQVKNFTSIAAACTFLAVGKPAFYKRLREEKILKGWEVRVRRRRRKNAASTSAGVCTGSTAPPASCVRTHTRTLHTTLPPTTLPTLSTCVCACAPCFAPTPPLRRCWRARSCRLQSCP